MNKLKQNLLSYGFVREYCSDNSVELLPSDIIELFVLWLTFCDEFDRDLSHDNIQFATTNDDEYGECQQISVKEYYHATAICKQIIQKGNKESWSFRFKNIATHTHAVLGVISDEIAREKKGEILDFSLATNKGYGLYIFDMRKYSEEVSWNPFQYGNQFEFKKGDVITMELDLTNDKGQLKFQFHSERIASKSSKPLPSNICFDDIDVNKKWRAAVAIRQPNEDHMWLLPYNA